LGTKRNLNEINVLRAIACLCVVLLHTIKVVVEGNFGGETFFEEVLLTLAGFLSFGTPAFVFISIILFSYKYPNSLPSHFYSKRVKAILIPFVSMAVFYGIIQTYKDLSSFPKVFFYNLMGDFHGWFVLLIFQFYVLFHLFYKVGHKFSSYFILVLSLIVNVAYLGYFNFTSMPSNSKFVTFIWNQGHWVPFLGWFFYFTFAYYCGRNYDNFLKLVRKNRVYIWGILICSIILILIDNYFNLFSYGSKRIDMILFTVAIVTLILQGASNIKIVNSLIDTISKYSFGIYLLHMFYLTIFIKVFELLNIHLSYWNIILGFFLVVVASIISINIVNKLPFGKYVVGGINDTTNKIKNKQIAEKPINNTNII
jgi:membrane-bound acyltransferase YfiQ involved in biofilm formation